MTYKPVDMHAKKSQILVIQCADPRFQEAYRSVIDSFGQYYDLLVFPGASKAIADHPVVVDNIKLLQSLHNFKSIHIIDHIDCGAFGKVDNEIKSHLDYLKKAARAIEDAIQDVIVVPHLLGQNSRIELPDQD